MQMSSRSARVVVTAAFTALLATLLAGCGPEAASLAACAPSAATPSGNEVQVYFGCGCFWHVQHEFVALEMSLLCRQGSNLSARAAYAGGSKTGPGELVCYHNIQDTADYGELGHAEVVSLSVPEKSFGAFATRFWSVCADGTRRDVQDMGGEYRSLIGLPGGMSSPLLNELKQKAGAVELVAGKGNEGDTLGSSKVLVYDTQTFPAHTAEKYHQFHDDMVEVYGPAYNSLERFATSTSCPGDWSSIMQ